MSTTAAASRAARRKTLGDSTLTAAERVLSQVAQFAIFILAARVLGPAEFGVFALVSACAILLLRASEAGWAPYIMSWSGDAEVPRQVVFVSILVGAACAALGAAAAAASGLFGMPSQTVLLMELFAFWVWLATVSSAQKGVMIWQRRLKSSALCEMAGELAGAIVAIALLLAGWGVLALVLGRLAYQSTHLALSFAVTRLAPSARLQRAVLRDFWVVAAQLFVSRFLNHVRLFVATFLIGGMFGPVAVGYFRAAERLVSALSEIIAVPAQILAWSEFRKARDNGPADGAMERVTTALGQFTKILIAVAVPTMAWAIVMSDALITGLLSSAWAPAAPLVAILALGRLLFLPCIVTEPVMALAQQTRRLPGFTAATFAATLLAVAAAAQISLLAVAWAQVVLNALILLASMALLHRHAGVRWTPVLTRLRGLGLPLVLGIAVLWGLEEASAGTGIPPLLRALGFALIALVTYGAALFALERPFFRLVFAGVRRADPH